MKQTLEDYIKSNLLDTIDYKEFISNPLYKMSYDFMKLEYKDVKK